MRIRLDSGAPQDGYLLISENHYPAWRATVDGVSVKTFRGDGALLTVPLNAGTQHVELTFVSDEYELGRAVTWGSLALVLVAFAVCVAYERWKGTAVVRL